MRGLIILFGVLIFIISLILLFRHYNNSSGKKVEERIAMVKSLIEEGNQTEAYFDSSYSILKIHGEQKQFSVNYQYAVDSKIYHDTKYFENKKDMPTATTFTIFYLKKDPSIHSANPKKELETLVLKSNEESTPKFGWWLFSISVLGFIYVRFSMLRERKKQKEMDEWTQQNEIRIQ